MSEVSLNRTLPKLYIGLHSIQRTKEDACIKSAAFILKCKIFDTTTK